MKRKRGRGKALLHVEVVLLVTTLAVVACGSADSLSVATSTESSAGERSVPVKTLLVDQSELPRAILDRYSLTHQKPDVFQMPVPAEWYGVEEYGQRAWNDEYQWLLSQEAFRFPSPAEAGREYQAAPYGRTFDLADGVKATTIPFAETDLGADEAVIFCAKGDKIERPVEHCPQWGFRGQYGRYIVDMTFRADADIGHPELKTTEFMALVRAVDGHAQKTLRG